MRAILVWNHIESLFYAVLDQPPSNRSHFLSGLSGLSPAVRREVERLLRLSETGDRFLEPPEPPPLSEAGQSEWSEDRWIGRAIGPFRIVSHIARGGMGSVWLAERADGLYHQRVAVKTLALSNMTELRRGHFDRERQALARLEHPYITRLIDGGASDDGIPFLVMELSEGLTIDAYCAEHLLAVPDRLRLFLKVCEAVQFAHQNLVVHADLKPRNILVGPGGTPKLLDFGVANLLAANPAIGAADLSRGPVRALTPWYASPELRRGEHATIASDVFSLGVILSELLTGCRGSPYQRARSESAIETCSVEARDRIFVTGTDVASTLKIGHNHRLGNIWWRADLEAVIAKATDREPAGRYRSVQHLADDLQNYLALRPVAARNPTAWHRFGKFVRRNRTASVLAFLVAVSLIGGVIGTAAGLRRTERQRDVAVRATQFIETLLSSSNPYWSGTDPSVLDVLANASSRIDEELAAEPEVEAEVRFAIARTYGSLWQWSDAKPHAERAMGLARALPHVRNADLADWLILLGRVLTWNHDDRAESIQREAVAIRLHLFGRNHPETADAKASLAFALWHTPVGGGNWTEAESLYREAIAVFREHVDARPRQLAMATYSLSCMLVTKGDLDGDAGALAEESIAHFRASSDLSDRYFAEALRNYSHTLRRQERWSEEASALEEYLARTPASFSLDSTALASRWRLQEIYSTLNDTAPADRWFRECILAECRARATIKSDRPTSPWALLTSRVLASSDPRIPNSTLQALVSVLRTGTCSDDLQLIQRIAQHARARCDAGDMDLARSLAEGAQPITNHETPSESIASAVLEGMYGVCLLRADRLEEAKPLLISSTNRLQGRVPLSDPIHRLAIERMVRMYEHTGELTKAEVYRDMLSRNP